MQRYGFASAPISNGGYMSISLLDTKLKPLEDRTKNIELLLENETLPRLQNIEACYTSTYRRYANGINQLEVMETDIGMIKKAVTEHSRKLQALG